jgi:ATP-dependent DNA helicase RecG
MAEAGLSEPVFINRRNEFVVILYNQKRNAVNDGEDEKQDTLQDEILKFCSVPRTREEIAEFVGLETIYYAMNQYVLPLIQAGKLMMTMPDKPKSKNQKYVIAKGIKL